MDRKTKGHLAETEAIAWFIRNGYEVYLPAHDCAKYDLIVHKEGILNRVSVKFCSSSTGDSWRVQLRNMSRRKDNKMKVDLFDSSSFDLVVVYIEPEDRISVIKSTEIKTKTELRIKKLRKINSLGESPVC